MAFAGVAIESGSARSICLSASTGSLVGPSPPVRTFTTSHMGSPVYADVTSTTSGDLSSAKSITGSHLSGLEPRPRIDPNRGAIAAYRATAGPHDEKTARRSDCTIAIRRKWIDLSAIYRRRKTTGILPLASHDYFHCRGHSVRNWRVAAMTEPSGPTISGRPSGYDPALCECLYHRGRMLGTLATANLHANGKSSSYRHNVHRTSAEGRP